MPAKRPSRPKRPAADSDRALRDHVIELLHGGHAHMVFTDAVADWPAELRGVKPPGQPFTAWTSSSSL
jgi:hypothetical protein